MTIASFVVSVAVGGTATAIAIRSDRRSRNTERRENERDAQHAAERDVEHAIRERRARLRAGAVEPHVQVDRRAHDTSVEYGVNNRTPDATFHHVRLRVFLVDDTGRFATLPEPELEPFLLSVLPPDASKRAPLVQHPGSFPAEYVRTELTFMDEEGRTWKRDRDGVVELDANAG